jgi:GH24 family phage-related lysozyme (muramidase)
MLGMKLSQKAVDKIIFFEVSSPAYYDKKLKKPTFPGGASGVTIGIGYDLGHNTKLQIAEDWGEFINAATIAKLQEAAGKKGSEAEVLVKKMQEIEIPYDIAREVFVKSLKRYAKAAKDAYDGLEELTPDAQGAIVSLVFNRGADTTSKNDRRKEMHAIKKLVKEKDYDGIAEQFESMKRLWGNDMRGILDRRDIEAKLVKNALREYTQDEIIDI